MATASMFLMVRVQQYAEKSFGAIRDCREPLDTCTSCRQRACERPIRVGLLHDCLRGARGVWKDERRRLEEEKMFKVRTYVIDAMKKVREDCKGI